MEISFNQKYPDGTRWPLVLLDFLEALSKAYEYPIDEFDLYAIIWDARLERLTPLLETNEVARRLFKECMHYQLERQMEGSRLRQEAKQAYSIFIKNT